MGKSQILRIGNIEPLPENFISKQVEKLKIYGITFNSKGFDAKSSFISSEESIQKFKSILAHRQFSLESRATFVNTYFLSKFWYCASFITPPEDLIDMANKAIISFLWYPSRKPKMKNSICQNSKIFGGFGAPNIQLKIKVFRLMFLANLHTYSNLKCIFATDWIL